MVNAERAEYLKKYNAERKRRYNNDPEYRKKERDRLKSWYQENKEKIALKRKMSKMYGIKNVPLKDNKDIE